MKKIHLVILAILILVFVFITIIKGSFSITLWRAGFSSANIQTLARSFDDNGNEIKIIKTNSKRSDIVLVYLVKNKFGFWKVGYFTPSSSNKLAVIGWMRWSAVRRFKADEDHLFEAEYHKIYYGNNAIKRIEFLPGQIPENVAVSIWQAGKEYYIHLICFGTGDASPLNSIDIHSLSLKNKCLAN
ncbi:hypothetical protein B0S90_2552 [Caldicellulosiruptor bescii]|uniref:Uncharacterized protein n=2 Tax=Caldicellulosiruptor bescii TaxID=31899 RepID=B9MMJ5_CALBD|nr:hypothetical protein [Caldicellulosiruptor bescii]ACM61294.1 conserved hypothetical protein [Caldicellulosiruptor bescii DSM 6725]PBC88893.1 hypothetical protein B0S87_1939 [Caldicellulosiruptor bescii]PBC91625.1 hypothetical protein B0S89_2053 [Caldicellulosiruptor bescii]PBD02962.1 hypothetical protein B0S85_0518 [Caldicellulosiruptor bescii]PBD07422.1 hypothetical protein B0S90_2552 [Caldicellulosiruptor bescii]